MAGFALPPSDVDGSACAAALARVDWSGFDAERDLPGLQELLRRLEEREGVTQAHRVATDALRERGAALSHPFGHELEVTGHALSPDGRYLVVSNPPDFFATEQGTLQVWELASGRCVNTFRVPEGLGWDGYGDCLQWSADSGRLVLNFCTSLIGRWDPFAEEPQLEADVSAGAVRGASRPVGFATLPDAQTVFVASGDWDSGAVTGVWGGLAPVAENYYYADYGDKELRAAQRLAEPSPKARELLDGGIVSPESMTVARDGRWLWGIGDLMSGGDGSGGPSGVAYGVDLTVPRLEWLRPIDFSAKGNPLCSAADRDGTWLACHTDDSVLILDSGNGEPLAEFPALPPPEHSTRASRLMWEPTGPRLAEFTSAAVRIHNDVGESHHLDVSLPEPSTRDQADLFPFAWAPDRPQFALLTADAAIELWDATATPRRLVRIEVPEHLIGLFWGADDVLVACGGDHLHFVRTDGRLLSDVPAARAPSEEDDDIEPGEVDFTLEDGTEVLVLPEGVIVAPPHRETELDEALTWSIQRRFGWPLRWGMPPVVPNLDAARSDLSLRTGKSSQAR